MADITRWQRVLILGSPGAGKSTAARRLSRLTGLPVIHLDYHYWQAGWQPVEADVWRDVVDDLTAQPRWIMDGNYGSTLPQRLKRGDALLHLDYPTRISLFRVIRRTIKWYGREREGEFVAGCPERFDWEFLRFVIGYRRTHRAKNLAAMAQFAGETYRFQTPAQLEAFITGLETAA